MPHSPLACDIDEQLDAAPNAWENYRDARVFLTGGTGIIGSWLTELFLAANARFSLNAQLTVLTRNPENFTRKFPYLKNNRAMILHTGDVRDFAFPIGHFTHILHAATASSGETKVSPQEMAATILDGTKQMLKFAAAQPYVRLLYVSSAAIYGRTRINNSPIREDDPGAPQEGDPNLDYDLSKRKAEALCLSAGIDVSIARCFAVVGPHLPKDTHFAIGNFIRDALAGKDIRVNGDGTPVRSYLYLADVARYLWIMLAHATPASIYNVGGPEAINMGDLARRVVEVVNSKLSVSIAVPSAGGALNYQVPDVSRIAADLQLTPLVPLNEAIRRTATWYKAY